MADTTANPSQRLHALDAVRGFALLAGIVFHASMSFIAGPTIWVVTDVSRGEGAGAIFYVLHIFRMTTFFLIAGFFGHLLFHRRGALGFIKDRLKRITLVLVAFWPIAMAGILAAAVYAVWMATGVVPKAPPPQPPAPPLAFPLTHLWFLYVLTLLYAATLLVRGLVAAVDRQGRLRASIDTLVAGLMRNPAAPLVLALPLAAALWSAPVWLMWFGIPTPDTNLVPNLPSVAAFGTAFGFGWVLHRQPGLLKVFRARAFLHAAAAIGLTATCILMIGLTPVVTPAAHDQRALTYAAAYAAADWCWTFAVIGLALRFLDAESPARRYIADASYWLYLIHLPIVMALQAAVSQLPLPWPLKLAGILAVAFALMFASYHLMVRYTWLGAILNGRRQPRPARAARLQTETAR